MKGVVGRMGRPSTISVTDAGGMRASVLGGMDRVERLRTLPTIEDLGVVRATKVVLAAAHRDHDTANNANSNLAAFCQRCHMNHDRPEHRRRRWRTLFRRRASGDLFAGPYEAR